MNDTATLVAQLEHAALIGGFERTLLRDAADRIAELEAALAICHRDIETLMSSCDKLEARNAELEAERDRLSDTARYWMERDVTARAEGVT